LLFRASAVTNSATRFDSSNDVIGNNAPPFVWIENQASTNGVQLGTAQEKNVPFYPTGQAGLNNYLATSGLSQTSTPTSYGVDVVSKNFKYPTKFRSNIGIDKKLDNNWVITAEFTYSKDINATYMANLNLNESNAQPINNGGDQRLRYNTSLSASAAYNTSNAYYVGSPTASLANPNLSSVILLANTNKGYSYQATFRIQKTIRNFNVGAAYIYNQTMSTMENGSTALSLWDARPVANTDPNSPTLAHPSWYQPHRVIAYGNWRTEYGKHFATIIGATWEAAPSGVTSYTYNGDLQGQGTNFTSLIYIPKNASDINLIDAGSYSATTHMGVTTGTAADPRTAAQIWTQLSDFITTDHYLYHHRGQYAQANSVVEPFFKVMDLHVGEDIFFFTGRDENRQRHTLSLTMDMFNVGNFISRNWGVYKQYNINDFLKVEGFEADGKTPLISFPYYDPTNQVPLSNNFSPSTSTSSRWSAQFGVRYEFN